MVSPNNSGFMRGQTDYDLLIVGGGIIGCWSAYKAGKRGLKTLLLEINTIGGGASGGVVGALMPHMPERWDGKKQFQFEALDELPDEIKILQSQTGISCGYNQCGRLAPIMNETKRGQMQGHCGNVETYWRGSYHWNIIDAPPYHNWPAVSTASHGLIHDTLSARINPRGLLKALEAAIRDDKNIDVIEHLGLEGFDGKTGKARLTDKSEVLFSHMVLCAGVTTFDFIAPMLNVTVKALGKPIKGQAAMLAADIDPCWPIVFNNGLYVIAYGQGKVAVGSTSENEFDNGLSTDEKLDNIIGQAKLLCPIIKNAGIIEKWAGLRPRAIGRDPLIDIMPDNENIIISTSGFKITFGIAHKMADVALEYIFGENKTKVPDNFKIPAHLLKARRAEKQDHIP